MINRRMFLQKASIAASSIAFFPSCMTNTENALFPKVGLQLYTVRNQMTENPRLTLEKIAKFGYTQIETASYDDGKAYGYNAKELKTLLGDLGLELISGHIPLQNFQNSFDKVLDFMAEAGQKYAVMPYLFEEQRQSIDQYKSYAETLNECGEKAKQRDMVVCYHNHDFEFQLLQEQLPMDILLNETDPSLVKMELDLYWVVKAGLDPISFFEQNKGRTPLWHVKDMANTEKGEFAEVGTGTIDFKSIFDQKELSGMEHYFIEQDQSDDPLKSVEISFNNLTKKILK